MSSVGGDILVFGIPLGTLISVVYVLFKRRKELKELLSVIPGNVTKVMAKRILKIQKNYLKYLKYEFANIIKTAFSVTPDKAKNMVDELLCILQRSREKVKS
jgi:DNA-directed RNA polymerase subunit F